MLFWNTCTETPSDCLFMKSATTHFRSVTDHFEINKTQTYWTKSVLQLALLMLVDVTSVEPISVTLTAFKQRHFRYYVTVTMHWFQFLFQFWLVWIIHFRRLATSLRTSNLSKMAYFKCSIIKCVTLFLICCKYWIA